MTRDPISALDMVSRACAPGLSGATATGKSEPMAESGGGEGLLLTGALGELELQLLPRLVEQAGDVLGAETG